MASVPANTKGVFILPKPSPGTATLPGSIILTDSTTVLDSAKRLALNGSPTLAIVTPSPLKGGANTPDSQAKCKRRLNFAKLGLGDKHKSSPKSVEKRNARERNRVKTINGNFESLRDHLPCGDSVMQRKKQKKMSKVDILKGAIDYISLLKEMLDETDKFLVSSSSSSSPSSPAPASPCPSTNILSATSNVPGSPSVSSVTSTSYMPGSPSVPSATSHLPGSSAPPLASPLTSTYIPSSPYIPHSPATSHVLPSPATSSYIPPSPSSSHPSPHPSHPPLEEMSFMQRMKFEAGSFLADLADPRPVHDPKPLLAPNSPAESLPGSVGSSSESMMSSSSPAPHLMPAHQGWDPDEEELRNFASWFQ